MSKFIILLVLFYMSLFSKAQSIDYEHIALKYFIDSVFAKNYKTTNTVEFSGYTEPELTSFSVYQNCFTEGKSLTMKLYEKSYNKVFDKKLIQLDKSNHIRFAKMKIKSSKKSKLYVLLANEIDDKFYVLIQVIKRKNYRDAYMFEIEKGGKILNYCKTGQLY